MPPYIINILKKSNAAIQAAKKKKIPDFCSNCKSKFPTFAGIKTQKLPSSWNYNSKIAEFYKNINNFV